MKRNHGGPTGYFWRPLKSAAGTASLESPPAWSSKTRGNRSPRAGGGSGLFPPAGSGPSAKSGAGQAPDAGRCQAPLTSHWGCARTARARSVRPSRQEGAVRRARSPGTSPRPPGSAGRREPRGRPPAGVRLAASRSCAALRGAGPGTLSAHGAGCRAPSCLFARGARGRRAELPGPPRRRAAPAGPRGSRRTGDAPRPPPPRGPAGLAGAAGGGGGGGGAAGTASSPPLASPPRATGKDEGTGHGDPGQ